MASFIGLCAIALCSSSVLLFGAPWIVTVYTQEHTEEIIKLVRFCAVFQFFDAAQVVGLAILRGMGDVKTPLIFHLTAYWFIGIPLSLHLCFQQEWGLIGLWAGLAFALSIVSCLCWIRIRYFMKTGSVQAIQQHTPPAS